MTRRKCHNCHQIKSQRRVFVLKSTALTVTSITQPIGPKCILEGKTLIKAGAGGFRHTLNPVDLQNSLSERRAADVHQATYCTRCRRMQRRVQGHCRGGTHRPGIAHLELLCIKPFLHVVQLSKQPRRKLVHQRCQRLELRQSEIATSKYGSKSTQNTFKFNRYLHELVPLGCMTAQCHLIAKM